MSFRDKLEKYLRGVVPEPSRSAIARQMGVNRITVSHWRSGERQPIQPHRIWLARVLGLSDAEAREFYEAGHAAPSPEEIKQARSELGIKP